MKRIIAIAFIAAFATTASASDQPELTALDLDHDKIISQQEAAGVPELIEQWKELDTNADGQLDFEELAKFAAAKPEETPAK